SVFCFLFPRALVSFPTRRSSDLHLRMNRLVALKMIPRLESADSEEMLRFRIEGEVLARLQHPHVVQIFDVGALDGRPYLALEYVDGGSLAARMAGKAWPARRAAALVETLAGAAHAAHLQGVVHRDLKPANVLLQNDERGTMSDETTRSVSSFIVPRSSFVAKITDFGLARQLRDETRLTRSGAIVGTPRYMAPEQ